MDGGGCRRAKLTIFAHFRKRLSPEIGEMPKLRQNGMLTRKACTYAALILADDGLDITSENLQALLEASGVEVEAIFPKLFSKAFEGKDVGAYFLNIGGASAGGVAAPVAAAAAEAPAAGKEEKKGKKEEKKEEEEEDDEMVCFLV